MEISPNALCDKDLLAFLSNEEISLDTTSEVPIESLYALARLREEAAAEVERLLAFLDATEPDPDLEEEPDCEPYLAGSQFGRLVDLEEEDEHDEDGGDREPWLGSVNPTISFGQTAWSAGGADDREGDPLDQGEIEHDGCEPDEDAEPSLGWTADGCIQNTSLDGVDCELSSPITPRHVTRGRLNNMDLVESLVGRHKVRLANGTVIMGEVS